MASCRERIGVADMKLESIKVKPRGFDGDMLEIQVEDCQGKGQTILHGRGMRTILSENVGCVALGTDVKIRFDGSAVQWVSSQGVMVTDGLVIRKLGEISYVYSTAIKEEEDGS